jgi:hypothetical protein
MIVKTAAYRKANAKDWKKQQKEDATYDTKFKEVKTSEKKDYAENMEKIQVATHLEQKDQDADDAEIKKLRADNLALQ